MKASPSNPDPLDPQGNDADPVWRLLARAPRPEPDGWFAARTLARCRHEGLRMESGVISFARMWRWALGGGLALSMALALVVTQIHSEKADKQKNVEEAFEIMASIDTDSDTSSSSWQDSSLELLSKASMGRVALPFSVWCLMACFSMSLRAQQPMAPAQVTPAPAMLPATNAAPVIPPLPPDTLGQYGKILSPSDQAAHPLKLKMPFPGVGEVKVPSQDELNMREKLEQLANLSDSDIRAQLEKWPAFGRMSLRDEGAMLQRIQDFRDYHLNVAMQKARDLGLLSTLMPDQKIRFEKDYWDKRLQMDRDLANQFEPIFKAREQKLQDELFREFSSVSPGPLAQAPKPPQAASSPVTQTASVPATTNTALPMQPIAQTPH